MKTILFTSFCLLNFYYSFCQDHKNDIVLSEINTNEIILRPPATTSPAINIQISDIKVIDARFDSISYGLYQNYPNKYYSIIARENAAREIAAFLKDYLHVEKAASPRGKNIIIVLRKLWLTNQLQVDKESADDSKANGAGAGGVIAKLEFYCSNGRGYSPLYRFDTTCAGIKNIKYNTVEYISNVLMLSVQKLIDTDPGTISPDGKKMSLQEIMLYSKSRFDIPILSTETYNKGVYKTFDEFKMNKPSLVNYEIREDKLTKTIFLKDSHGEYPLRESWGYCDGTNLFIGSADNYFKLIKNQNTFISNAVRSISRTRNIKAGNVIALGLFAGGVGRGNKKVSYTLSYKLYELDMDTGELY